MKLKLPDEIVAQEIGKTIAAPKEEKPYLVKTVKFDAGYEPVISKNSAEELAVIKKHLQKEKYFTEHLLSLREIRPCIGIDYENQVKHLENINFLLEGR